MSATYKRCFGHHQTSNRPTGPLLRESTGCIFNTKGIVLVTQPNLQPECESGRSRTDVCSAKGYRVDGNKVQGGLPALYRPHRQGYVTGIGALTQCM